MSASAGMSVSTAILLASGLIAVSIFFGLSGQRPVQPVAGSVAALVAPEPAPVVAPPPPVSSTELVKQQASEALAYQRSRLRDVCYRPAVLAAKAELSAVWNLNVTFDAQGDQLARGMEEQRGTSTPELSRCVGDALQPLKVPPPGRDLMVEIPLSFP